MAPLATTADLTARGIDTSDTTAVTALLDAASAEVRNAAGVPISRETFTVDVPGRPEQWMTLPGQPIVSVADVLLDGDALDDSDWRLVGGRIWRRRGWQARAGEPSVVTMTITGGLDPVPADIVDLVCSMVGAALTRMAEEGYETRGDLVGVRIDDYSEQYQSSAEDRLAGVMELPSRTRRRLASRFGGGAAVVRTGA